MPCYNGCNYITIETLNFNSDESGTITHRCNTCGFKCDNSEITQQYKVQYIHQHLKENTIFAGQTHEQANDVCIKYNVLKCNQKCCKYYYLIPQNS